MHSLKKLGLPREQANRFFTGLLVTFVIATTPVFAQKVSVVTEEMAPYNFIDDRDKTITGLSTEIVQEVLRRTKIEYKIAVYPWARSYRIAQEDPNIAIYSIGRNEERENIFKWVGVIANRDIYLYKLKSRPEVKADKLSDLKSYVLGGIRDGIRTQYLISEGLAVDLTNDDISNIRKLQIGRIDAFPADELAASALAKNSGIEFNSLGKMLKLDKLSGALYLAFSLNTDDQTVEKCRVALDEIKKDGTFHKITAKWLQRK